MSEPESLTAEAGIGKSVKRVEDQRFLTGKGRYTDDVNLSGQLYAYFVRSPYAHAKIARLDIEAARSQPGIVAIFTSRDLHELGGLPCGWLIHNRDGSPMTEPKHPILAEQVVRHVGEPIVLIIAEKKEQAVDASELIDIQFEELPCVISTKDSVQQGAPQLHGDTLKNTCFDWELGDGSEVKAAFKRAAHISQLEFTNNRVIPNAMEPRCVVSDYDSSKGEYTLYTSTQAPHVIRLLMCAFVLNIPEHKVRIVSPDVGGGFGSKTFHYPEEAALTWASAKLDRPIKWNATRSEAFLTDAHGRDHQTIAELALDEDGHFLALRVSTLANLGAYLSTFATAIPTYMHGTLLAGTYRTPAIYVNVKGVFTNTNPVDAYRGAGRPEATYLLERLIDVAAQDTGRDPIALRRLNLIQPDQFPYETPVGLTYDSGNYGASMDQVLAFGDFEGFQERKSESQTRGKLRGIGVANYIEACGIAPSAIAGELGGRAGGYESATVRVHPTGSISVLTGSHSHGQGHETTFAQIVSDMLGVGFDQVDVIHGDTGELPFGLGTYGSRSLVVGGSAIVGAVSKVIEKGKKITAHMLEAMEDDIEFEDGVFRIAGTDRQKTFPEIAFSAYVPHNYPLDQLEPGLEESAFYDPSNFTFPAGSYLCEVEIDPNTGAIEIVQFCASDDFGTIINPMIVDGQVHGGIAQGVGQALLEHGIYDDSGQLLTGSYLDYAMPRADSVPYFKVDTTVTKCDHNPLGSKGCGEAGAIGSPPAIMNAIVNALSDYGVTHIDMPATPERIWRVLQGIA